MVRVTDEVAGELVAIPKFWYKITKEGNTFSFQIADGPVKGFYTSMAHIDRGDGYGERDIVYVGRYHCATNYKSISNAAMVNYITRDTARVNIQNLGSTIWQYDITMLCMIRMLYLVEFADWDSQAVIGIGCSGKNSTLENTGTTDDMPYHTGTTANTRSTYSSCQYRNIEGLWDGLTDWVDGIATDNDIMYVILNPINFSDTEIENGIAIESSIPINTSNYNGCISEIELTTVNNMQFIYPIATNGNTTSYISDRWYNSTDNNKAMWAGGVYNETNDNARLFGLFCTAFCISTYSWKNNGCRLMVLPNNTAA
jgi:hypothetical protein